MSIIERIEALMESEHLSANAFAIKVGVYSSNFCRMLADKQTITDKTLRKISDAMGCSFEWLKFGEGEMRPEGYSSNAATTSGHTKSSVPINDREMARRLLALLERKEQQIDLLIASLDEKDKQINQLIQILSSRGKQLKPSGR